MTDSNDSVPTQALSRRSLRTPEPKAPGRISAIIRKHPTAWLISAIAVVFLLLGTSAVFAGVPAGGGPTVAAPLPTETADPRPQPSAVPVASRLRTCAVASVMADPRLADFAGYVVNTATGETLFDHKDAKRLPSFLDFYPAKQKISRKCLTSIFDLCQYCDFLELRGNIFGDNFDATKFRT